MTKCAIAIDHDDLEYGLPQATMVEYSTQTIHVLAYEDITIGTNSIVCYVNRPILENRIVYNQNITCASIVIVFSIVGMFIGGIYSVLRTS